MTQEQDAAIREWARLFNRGDYFEAHEVVEIAWLRAEEGADRTFLKGLIHAAVALAHYQRGNGHGARVKYASALRYLAGHHPVHGGVEVSQLTAEMDRFFADLVAQPRGTPPPPPQQPWPGVVLSRP